MLDLDDIIHLPELDEAVAQLVADGPGLAIVAGLDPPPVALSESQLPPPSGRTSLLRMLARRALAASKRRAVILAGQREFIRVSREQRGRADVIVAGSADELRARILALAGLPPELMIIERLEDAGVVAAACELASRGTKILAQMDTPFRGLGVVRELLDAGVARELLSHLTWVVAIQRVPQLCGVCASPVSPEMMQFDELRMRFPEPIPLPQRPLDALGCEECNGRGHRGELALFDIYRPNKRTAIVSYEMYALKMAEQGRLSLDDVLALDAAPLQQAHALQVASESALREMNATLQRKVAELESAHRVSAQRTEALVSLQRMSEALLSDALPDALAGHICRQARELCGAERVILYAAAGDQAEAIGEAGWGPERLPGPLPLAEVCGPIQGDEPSGRPALYSGWPPGIPPRAADVEGAELRAGLRVALIAQGEIVGAMIVHSTVRSSFAPGHVALLQTFAGQAALALQRASLTAELRAKVAALEAAQAELAVKARMARELELARQVQQSFLPRTFPSVPGYAFAAHNEPAREVGGDFYDVIDLGSGRIGLVVADVSDKGMAAALYMALSRSLIRAEAIREISPRTVLLNVNRLLLQLGEPGMFVSVFYGVLDTTSGELIYARAGHDRPLLLRSADAHALQGQGMLLGVFDEIEASLTEERTRLASGDRLVLYTDGLTDVVNARTEMLGKDGLTSLLLEHSTEPANLMCGQVARGLEEFRAGAEQADDMTLLIVEALFT